VSAAAAAAAAAAATAPRPVAMVARIVAAARISILATMGDAYADANARTVRSDILITATLRAMRALEPVLEYFQPRVVVIEKQPGGNRESIASGSPFSLKMNDIATAIQSYFILRWEDRMDRIATQSTARKAKGMQCWTTQLYRELNPPKASRAGIPRSLVPDWAAAASVTVRKRARRGGGGGGGGGGEDEEEEEVEVEEEEEEVEAEEEEVESHNSYDSYESEPAGRTVISLLDDDEDDTPPASVPSPPRPRAPIPASAPVSAPVSAPPPPSAYDQRKHDANKATSVSCLLLALRDTHGPIHRLPERKSYVPDASAPRWRLVDGIHLHDRMRRVDPRMAGKEGNKFDDIADAFWHAISAVCEDEGWIPAPSSKL